MIASFLHKGLREYWHTGRKSGITAVHATCLAVLLQDLDAASQPHHMGMPGYGLHSLSGKLAGHWAVKVTGNVRVTFRFNDKGNALDVNYLDYHQELRHGIKNNSRT